MEVDLLGRLQDTNYAIGKAMGRCQLKTVLIGKLADSVRVSAVLEQKFDNRQVNLQTALVQSHRQGAELHQNGATHRYVVDVGAVTQEHISDHQADISVLKHILRFCYAREAMN